MVEIGNNQSDRYNAHIGVLQIISVTCALVIGFSILYHKEIIPGNIISVLLVVTISVGIILTIRKIIDLFNRSNLVYDQYNWHTDHAELQPGYQGVFQHDKLFFERLGQEIEGTVKKGGSELKHAANVVDNTMTQNINKAANVQPTHSASPESFSTLH